MQAAVLHLTSAVGGGVDRYIRDLAGATSRPHWIWHVGSGLDVIEDVARGQFSALRDGAVRSADAPRLAAAWRASAVGIVHQHSVMPAALDTLEWLDRELALPRLQTLHDVSFVDPEAFSAPSSVAPDSAWRHRVGEVLRGASEVIVPSPFIARLVARQFDGVATRMVPPGLGSAPPPNAGRGVAPDVAVPVLPAPAEFVAQAPRHIVAVVGAIGPHKGSALLEPLATALHGSDIGLVVIGYTDGRLRPGWVVPGCLYVHGPYRDDAVGHWLDAYRARIVLFPNRLPESFSYTLSEVWAAGRPVVVPDEGALGERVARYGGGWRLPAGFDVDDAVSLLGRLLGPAGSAERAQVESELLNPDPDRIPTLAAMAHELDGLYARYAKPDPRGAAGDPPADLSPLLAINLDGARFRDELIRLVGELATAETERDAARGWATKLERDVADLKADAGRLFDENRRLIEVEAAFVQLPGFVRRLLFRMALRGRR